MKLATVSLLFFVALASQLKGADYYPEVRELIREAEMASVHISMLNDHSRPAEWEGHLYARAGYLDDAARAFARGSIPAQRLWTARVVYGDLASVEKEIAAMADPAKAASAQLGVTDILWKMGDGSDAKNCIEAARKLAMGVKDATRRERLIAEIGRGFENLNSDPPIHLSAMPEPQPRMSSEKPRFPAFPITTEGFADSNPREIELRSSEDSALIKDLYGRMAANDRVGLLRIIETAQTPFQKTLAIASVEHILIQAGQPDAAEQTALKIPEVDAECLLAKAEALSAAARAWVREGNVDRGQADFDAGVTLARSVRDLPIGRISVIVAIASSEGEAGMAASAQGNLKVAERIVLDMPLRPVSVSRSTRLPAGIHYRDEAYKPILAGAIRIHDLAAAREVCELWRKAGGFDDAIAYAWLEGGQPREAMAFARGIAHTPERVKIQLAIAQRLLDEEGAPNI